MDVPSYLLGKKAGGGSGGTSNYNDLSNKPSINDVILSGNKTLSDLGVENTERTFDIQKRLNSEYLEEFSTFITENIDKVVNIRVVDGSSYVSEGNIYIQNTIPNYTPATNEMTTYGTTINTIEIRGSWANSVYTINEVNTVNLNTGKGLAVDNTTAYIPSGDYNPAPKGYVDSAISGKQDTLVSGTNIKTINNTSLLGSGDITVSADNILVIENTGSINNPNVDNASNRVIFKRIIDAVSNNIKLLVLLKSQNPSNANQTIFANLAFYNYTPNSNKLELYFNLDVSSMSGYSYSYGVAYRQYSLFNITINFDANTDITSISATKRGLFYALNDVPDFLGIYNTTSYTPTRDYNPATKKYVDDMVGNINTVLATLTTPSSNS